MCNRQPYFLNSQPAYASAFTASTSFPPFAITPSPTNERATKNSTSSGVPKRSLVSVKISALHSTPH